MKMGQFSIWRKLLCAALTEKLATYLVKYRSASPSEFAQYRLGGEERHFSVLIDNLVPRAVVRLEPVEDDRVAAVVPGERLVGVRVDDLADEHALADVVLRYPFGAQFGNLQCCATDAFEVRNAYRVV